MGMLQFQITHQRRSILFQRPGYDFKGKIIAECCAADLQCNILPAMDQRLHACIARQFHQLVQINTQLITQKRLALTRLKEQIASAFDMAQA